MQGYRATPKLSELLDPTRRWNRWMARRRRPTISQVTRWSDCYPPDSGDIVPLVFGAGGNARQVKLPAMVTVTGPETNVARACMGLGLIQVPWYRVSSELAGGALIEVLAGFPPLPLPVHVLYSHTRQLSPRMGVFIDWMAEQFRDRLSPSE
jgi:DNA-binding transcriptional LysR family regulator